MKPATTGNNFGSYRRNKMIKLKSGLKVFIGERTGTIKGVSYMNNIPDQVLLYFEDGDPETVPASLFLELEAPDVHPGEQVEVVEETEVESWFEEKVM